MKTSNISSTRTEPVQDFALKQRSGINLTLYLAGVGSAGMTAMPNAEAAVLYQDFGPDLAANSQIYNSLTRIQLSIDVVNGLSASLTSSSSTGDITLTPYSEYTDASGKDIEHYEDPTPFLPHELRPNPFFTDFPPEANS